MAKISSRLAASWALSLLATVMGPPILDAQTNLITPWAYLASQPKPNFAPGNTLPRLNRDGWVLTVSSNTVIELANDWDYTLPIDAQDLPVTNIFNPNSPESLYVSLAAANPAKYTLSVKINIHYPQPVPDAVWVTNTNGWFVDVNSNSWQYATNTAYTKVVSPEGPDSFWSNAATYWVNDLIMIQSNAPIGFVLADGEYGLAVAAVGRPAWQFDPRVQAEMATNGLTWPRYATVRKARQLGFATAAIEQALANRRLNIYYSTCPEEWRVTPNWQDWWGFDSDLMVTNSDFPAIKAITQTRPAITLPIPPVRPANAVSEWRRHQY